VNQILDGTFRGKIEVVRVGRLQADGLDGGVVTLVDPYGQRVALLEGVHARIALAPLLASLIGGGDMRVRVSELSIDHIDALLKTADDGALTIAESFQPGKEGPPPPPTKKKSGLILSLPKIALKHAWIHGGMSGVPVIDADLDELAASFGMTPDTTSVEVRRLRLATRGLPGLALPNGAHADAGAQIEAHLVLPADVDKMSGGVVLVGSVGGVDLNVHGAIDGKKVDGVVDVPKVEPEALARILGSSPIRKVATAHIEAHGTLPLIQPRVHVTLGDGTVDVGGDVTVPSDGAPDTVAKVTLAARDLDVRDVMATSPASKLGMDVSLDARLGAAGDYSGSYDVHVLPGSFGPQPTPDARITGTLAPTSIKGSGHIAIPGVPTDLRFDMNPIIAGGPDVAFDATVKAEDLSKVPHMGRQMNGRGSLHAAGNVALGSKRIRANFESVLDRVNAGGIVVVEEAKITGMAEGNLTSPSAAVAIAGHGLRAQGYAYPTFHVNVAGTPEAMNVGAELHGGKDPAVTLAGTVGTTSGVTAHDVIVTLAKGKDRVVAKVARASSKSGKVDVEGLSLEGAGKPLEVELHIHHGEIDAKAKSEGVDVPTLLRIAGIQTELTSGSVGLDVDLQASKRTTAGHANVDAHGVTYANLVRQLEAKVETNFTGTNAKVHLDARDAAHNQVTLDTENARLAGGALDPHAWMKATGRAHVVTTTDLQHIIHHPPGSQLPFEQLSGRLTATIDVARDDATKRPGVMVDAQTRDLVFTTEPAKEPNGDGTVTVVGRSFHSEGLDAHVKASVDGETGKTAFDAVLKDKEGTLAEANASTKLPVTDLLAGRKDALLNTFVRTHIEVPTRSIGAVPALMASVPARGKMGLVFDAEGTARAPHLQTLVHLRDIVDADDPTPTPISFDVAAIYDGDLARAKLVAVRDGKKVLDVTTDATLHANDLLAGTAPWQASADVAFTGFPIGAVTGFFDENSLDGSLDGTIALHDLHKAADLVAKLDLSHLAINGSKFGDTKATLAIQNGKLAAETSIVQPDGSAHVKVTAAMNWGDAVAPSLDDKSPIKLGLQAKNFRLAMIAPFVRSVLSELDGRLNANATVDVKPGMKDGSMNGAIVLDHGLFETPTIGEEFHNLKARIYMKPWGTWNVAEISADGTSGHFTANAVANVQGLSFKSGEAHLKIAEKDKLPLTMQGIDMGTLWGQIDTKAATQKDGKTIDIDVNVPNLHVELPQSIGHSVQATDADPTIKVGSIGKDGIVAILPVDGALPPPKPPEQVVASTTPEPAMKMHITTHLGPDLEIRRDTMVRAYVAGGPTIDIGKETKITGGISVPRGYIELQGKRFQIEKGTVNFTGQSPDNPVVVATAAYDSPDGTKVYADFVGPVQTGKLTLRSEPELTQNEILALLLFGSADGTFGQAAPQGQGGNTGTEAASLAGGVVTQGLNKAISGVTGVEVQTKVDTQESGDPRPEVEVALSRDVSATLVYNLGVPTPGQSPDDTLLLLDWRFHKNYSTEATVGDKGTSILDLTWKYRY
jgi:translocation and assembly module TamB